MWREKIDWAQPFQDFYIDWPFAQGSSGVAGLEGAIPLGYVQPGKAENAGAASKCFPIRQFSELLYRSRPRALYIPFFYLPFMSPGGAA